MALKFLRVFAADVDGVQVSSSLDEKGREHPDPVPMAPPVGIVRGESMADMVRRMVRSEHLKAQADEEGLDTFEESEDFDIEDDPLDPHTPYEAVFDPQPSVAPAAPLAAPAAAPVPTGPASAEPVATPAAAPPPSTHT